MPLCAGARIVVFARICAEGWEGNGMSANADNRLI